MKLPTNLFRFLFGINNPQSFLYPLPHSVKGSGLGHEMGGAEL
jgi:hypothetical protein